MILSRIILILSSLIFMASGQNSEPVRTEWRSPDGSKPMTYEEWKSVWDSSSRREGGKVVYRTTDKTVIPADTFVFGHDYAYFKDHVRHSDGTLCEDVPPQASFIVYLNGNDDRILSDEAPRWSFGDPNISGMGWFGVELGNFSSPAISIGDTFTFVFSCYPPNEMPEQGSYDKEIIMLPMVAWPSTLHLQNLPIPRPPEGLTLNREGSQIRLGWEQQPEVSYTIYRRNQNDTLVHNYPRYQYHKLAINIIDSCYVDSTIDSVDTYGYLLFARDLSSGLISGRSREIRESETLANVRAIVVQPELYADIQSNLFQLVADWEAEDAQVIVYAMQFPTVGALRDTLHSISGLRGALLIGNFPVPWFQFCDDSGGNYQEYPADLYFMDLDGSWEDNFYKPPTGPLLPGSDGIFDTHYQDFPRTTEKPEIVIGRIIPTPGMGDAAEIINNYLFRCYQYRRDTGGVRQDFKALAYPDDDWNSWGNDIATLYMSRVYSEYTCIYDINATTGIDYRDRLNDHYSLIHVYVHSWSGGHAFTVNNGNQSQYFYNYQIVPSGANANFYHLFACGNSRYVEDNNCAAVYAFMTPAGINTIGSTHSGGMLEFDYFYIALSQGISFGEAFLRTFQNGGRTGFSANMRSWSYGLTFNGDPFVIPLPPLSTQITQNETLPIPGEFVISNFPNPFNSTTRIRFKIPRGGMVGIEIYNSLGQKIKTLELIYAAAGNYLSGWDGRDDRGSEVSSGIYFVGLRLDQDLVQINKMVLMR